MHGHQLDDVDAEVGEIGQVLHASVEGAAEPPDVHLVDDGIGVVTAERRLLRPCVAHHRTEPAVGRHDVRGVRIEQRSDSVDDEPVEVSVDRIELGHPRRAVFAPRHLRFRRCYGARAAERRS
jgi:hypothetical protein